MTLVAETAKLLRDFGLVGLLALALGGVVSLFLKLQRAQEARVKDAQEHRDALLEESKAQTAAIATVVTSLDNLCHVVDRLERVVDHCQKKGD